MAGEMKRHAWLLVFVTLSVVVPASPSWAPETGKKCSAYVRSEWWVDSTSVGQIDFNGKSWCTVDPYFVSAEARLNKQPLGVPWAPAPYVDCWASECHPNTPVQSGSFYNGTVTGTWRVTYQTEFHLKPDDENRFREPAPVECSIEDSPTNKKMDCTVLLVFQVIPPPDVPGGFCCAEGMAEITLDIIGS